VGVRVEGEEIAADPVPVRRPGVRVKGVDGRDTGCGTSEEDTGSTNMGLNRKASHNISTQDAQFETMISPAFGFQCSAIFVLLGYNERRNTLQCRSHAPPLACDGLDRDPEHTD